MTILAIVGDKARHESWQKPTYTCELVPRGMGWLNLRDNFISALSDAALF